MSVNSVNMITRVSLAPEKKEFSNGGSIATIGTCWNNRYFNKAKEEWESIPNYFEVVVQNKNLVDKVMDGVKVGDLLMVNGQLRYRQWEVDGQKRSTVHIYAFDLVKCDFLPKAEANGADDNFEL